ncbi:MAG: hypothetical protein HY984_00030 [Candidatus Magasanikbacteria bacterium]|nr:hypothetical protein [Candidatus Magasanikbacteria bacterium]
MSVITTLKQSFGNLLAAFANFKKENTVIREETKKMVRETEQTAEKKKLLDTLDIIDKL